MRTTLEFGGYVLHTSYAYPHNLLNALVSGLHGALFRSRAQETPSPGLELEPPIG